MSKDLKYTEYTRDFPKTLTGKKTDEGYSWQKQSSPNHTKLNPNKRQYNITRTLVLLTPKKKKLQWIPRFLYFLWIYYFNFWSSGSPFS